MDNYNNLTFMTAGVPFWTFMTGTGGGGAFFFFLCKDIPSVDDDNDDVDPLKLCPGELWLDIERGVGSGVAECLEYLYFNILIYCTFDGSTSSNEQWK